MSPDQFYRDLIYIFVSHAKRHQHPRVRNSKRRRSNTHKVDGGLSDALDAAYTAPTRTTCPILLSMRGRPTGNKKLTNFSNYLLSQKLFSKSNLMISYREN